MFSNSYRIQQIGDSKYNCPFCVIVKRDPPWNPANSGKLLKDQLKSWQTHLGLCPNRKKAEKIVNEKIVHEKALEQDRKRARSSNIADVERNRSGEILVHLPTANQVHRSLGTNQTTENQPTYAFAIQFVNRLDPNERHFTGIEPYYDDVNHLTYFDGGSMSSSSSDSASGSISSSSSSSSSSSESTGGMAQEDADKMFLLGTGRPCLMLDEDTNMASNVVYKHQQQLQEAYSPLNLFHDIDIRASVGATQQSRLTYRDFLGLAIWFENASVSIEDGNALLKVLNKILEDRGLLDLLHFPKQAETVFKFATKRSEILHPIHNFEMKIPEDQWGSSLPNGNLLPPVQASYFSFLEELGERALSWDPEKVKWRETEEEKKENKITTILTSQFGRHVAEVLDIVNERDRNNTIHGKRIMHVPLYLGLTLDDTQTNRTGADACPLLIELKNFPDDPFMLGLVPKCPLTNATLQNIQAKLGCTHKGVVKEQIKTLKRHIRFKYIEEAVKEARAHHKNGVLLQIGPDGRHYVIAHPIICVNTGDGKERYDQCSISWQMSGCKCCFCMEENCLRFTNHAKEWKPRNDTRMMTLSFELDRIQKMIHGKLCVDTNAQTKKKEWYSEHDLNIIAEASACNILPSSCTIFHDLGLDVNKIWGIPKFGLHCMGAVDMLHTFLKGIVENAISWTMSCLYMLQDINPEEYRNIVSNLDAIFHTFPYNQSVTPVPLFYKEYGISKMITDARSKKQSAMAGTGTGVGGTPAAHLPGVAFMLLHAIGKEGGATNSMSLSRIPEEIVLPTRRAENERYKPRKEYKIRTILVNALQSVLNALTFARKADGFSDDNLDELDYLLQLARGHVIQLWSLKSDLKQMRSGVLVADRVDPKFTGIKHHLLEHLTFCIRLFGAPDHFDTQNSEHFHVKIKRYYRETSRRKDSSDKEILQHFSRVRRLNCIQKAFPSPSSEIQEEEPVILTPGHQLSALKQTCQDKLQKIKHLQNVIGEIEKEMILKYHRHVKSINMLELEAAKQTSAPQRSLPMDANLLRIIRLNKMLEAHQDSLYSTFHVPKCTRKAFIEVDPSTFKSNVPLEEQAGTFFECPNGAKLLHPFIDFKQLFTYLNLKTPDGLSKEFFQSHKKWPQSYKIKLNEMISSRGKPELGIQPFTIHCNAETNYFSAVEVSFQTQVQEIVRIFGIVTLHEMSQTNPPRENNVRTLLVCACLKRREAARRLDSIHCPILEYEIVRNALEVDVIDLTSIIRPACLMPIFTSIFRPDFEEKRADLTADRRGPTSRYYGLRQFYHVPIPTMRNFKVINFGVIDAAINVRYRSTSFGTGNAIISVEETAGEKRQREERESNYIAHHLFLSEQELTWTERSNVVFKLNVHARTFRQDMWRGIENGDLWKETADDEDDDEIVIL